MSIIAGALSQLEHPKALWLIPVLMALAFWLLRKDFVKLAEDFSTRQKRKRQQIVMLFTRALIIIVLVLAIASPFTERTTTVQGDPFLKILVDNSQSMSIYASDEESGMLKLADTLKATLEQAISVEVHTIASGIVSIIGDGILNSIRDSDNVLLITDGNANTGASLADVALFAAGHNITFNALALTPRKDDAWVSIEGPEKTVANIDNTFTITTGWASRQKNQLRLVVTVDGKQALDTTDTESMHTLTKRFAE